MRIFFLIISIFIFSQCSSLDSKINIGIIIINENGTERAAVQSFFADKASKYDVAYLNIETFDAVSLNQFDLLWIHRPDSSEIQIQEKRLRDKVTKYVSDGGKLFLSLDAVRLLNTWDVEPQTIDVSYREMIDEGYGRKVGIHAFRSHPVFTNLFGGAYIWHGKIDKKLRTLGFFSDKIPLAENSHVIGVESVFITYFEDRKLLWESNIGKGKILSLGAYLHFSDPNYHQIEFEQFVENCFAFLNGDIKNVKEQFWTYDAPMVKKSQLNMGKTDSLKPEKWKIPKATLSKSRTVTKNYYSIPSPTVLTQGKELGGIEEIWTHPFMSVRDILVAIQIEEKSKPIWLTDIESEIEIRPDMIIRKYRLSNGVTFKEVVVNNTNTNSVIAHYEWEGNLYRVITTFKSNLRFMWPYSEKALGSIFYQYNKENYAFMVHNESEEFFSIIGSNVKPKSVLNGAYDGFIYNNNSWKPIETDLIQVSGLMEFDGKETHALDLCFSASATGIDKAIKDYNLTLGNPAQSFRNSSKIVKGVFDNYLQIHTPDSIFNEGYKWALISTAQFEGKTPGIGTSLMAGYSTTARGWDGAQPISGRPGYAWYFGRDAQWSALAVNDYGDFDLTRDVLETFIKFQNVDGKIYHELTTSGSVHYDGSDATPLFVVLFGDYFRHSGDVNFVKNNWSSIEKAMAYCYSTDRDNDGLIEISNVGHGWLEGGALYGSQTEFYLAGIWVKALEEAAYLAKIANQNTWHEKYDYDAKSVKGIINNGFWNADGGYYNYGKYKDGSYTNELIILSTVPAYLNVLDKDKSIIMMEKFAQNDFSSDWGVRMVGKSYPKFNPRSYHFGSIWPLFTGWTSLAEYATERSIQGFTRIMDNLMNYKSFALGRVSEVLHGERYEQSGVTQFQCWSETMVIQPIVEGMLGFNPDALDNRFELNLSIPFNWDTLSVNNLKIKDNSISLEMDKSKDRVIYKFEALKQVGLNFTPEIPLNTQVNSVVANGEKIDFRIIKNKESWRIEIKPLEIDTAMLIKIEMVEGKSVLPKNYFATEGSTSSEFSILNQEWIDNNLLILLEGIPGNRNEFEVYVPGGIQEIKGGEIVDFNSKNSIAKVEVYFNPKNNKKTKKVFIK